MSYRLLSTKRWSQHNFKRVAGSAPNNAPVRGNLTGLRWPVVPVAGSRSYSLFCVSNLVKAEQKLSPISSSVGTGFSSTIFTTHRTQSTIPDTLEVVKETISKKRHYKMKFAELIQMNPAGTLANSKTKVQKLKNKRLTEFINKVAATIPDNIPDIHKAAASPLNDRPNKKYKKKSDMFTGRNFSLVDMANEEMLQKFQLAEDEAPLLFVRRRSLNIVPNSAEMNEVLNSYMTFKEMTAEAEEQQEQECVELLDPLASDKRSDPRSPFIGIDEIAPKAKPTNNSKGKTEKTTAGKQHVGKQHKSAEHEQLGKQKALFQHLAVYLDICVHNGMITRGMNTLQHYRNRSKNVDSRLNMMNIDLFNIILAGYAATGTVAKVRKIMEVVKEDGVKCSPQTYAAVFECLMRTKDEELSVLKQWMLEYRDQAAAENITLNDIMVKSKFVRDQRSVVLKAIRWIDPKFEPQYQPPTTYYTNVLVQQLNKHLRPLSEKINPNSPDAPGSEIMLSKNGFRKHDLVAMGKEQLKMEQESIISIKSIEKFPEPTETVQFYRDQVSEMRKQWRTQVEDAFHRDYNTVRLHTHSKGNFVISIFPFLQVLPVEEYVNILLNEARALSEGSETFSLTTNQLYKHLGKQVQSKYYMERKRRDGVLDKTNRLYEKYCDILSGTYSSDNPRQSWQRLVYHSQTQGPSMDIVDDPWPGSVLHGIGRFLYQILLRDVKIDANAIRPNSKSKNLIPAFYSLFRNEGKFVKEEIKPHPVLSKLIRGSQLEVLHFESCTVPMLCPPLPWSTPQNGGYIVARSELIRLPFQAHQQWETIHNIEADKMYPALDSLNQLASIGWRVNTTLLDIILEVFNAGGNKKLDVPQPSSALAPIEPVEPKDGQEISKSERYHNFRLKLLHRRKQAEMHSMWCDTLYRLSLANHFRDKVFWLPHNMDFRGRVYPIPPHLNHLGSDLARCLLVFNQKKPLGPNGFAWLKLHCINLTGFKKKNAVADRLAYAEEVMDDILDSADNPLTGRMWWASSDEPWQTLAACVEIARVHRSPDPEKFMSSFPIHQDGSCNGLQHYAALGRDTAGAISVNLAPCDVPQDVYSDVAALVEEARRVDAEGGLEVAKVLEGFIKRVVIKQTVMTTVYGVTRFGARTQISRQLKDTENFPKEWLWPAATYLTHKTFDSLREMFTSTREIQDWFTQCARLIASTGGHNVSWTTPLGLPIVQPYNRYETYLHSKSTSRVQESMQMDSYLKPNVMKQKNAFPPNFIHSLDSSHMMLTSLHCDKRGLTFMSVHDCYWTHACTVAEMNRICREQFVALHSQPILEDLSTQLTQKYSYPQSDFANDGSVVDLTKRKLNRALLQLPSKGDFDLKNVLDSVYFFS